MKRQYLHIEFNESDSETYIYCDNNTWNHKELTLQQLDTECYVKPGKYYIDLMKFMGKLMLEKPNKQED